MSGALLLSTVSALTVALLLDIGGLGTVGGGTVDISVIAPSLSTPLVLVLVVPFVIRLSFVSLGAGLVVGDLLVEVLITAPSIPVGSGSTLVVLTVSGGSGLLVATLSLAVATIAAIAFLGVVELLGSSSAVLVLGTLVVSVVVLGPLVVISHNLTGVVLVVVVASLDGVVGLAPSGVVVLAGSLLGPDIVVSTSLGLLSLPGSGTSLGLAVSLTGSTVSTIGTWGSVSSSLSLLSTIGVVVVAGSIVLGGGSTVHVAVLAPLLGTPLVVILVVPFVIGLGLVGLGLGLSVRLVNGEILVSAPSIPVGGVLGLVLSAVAGGSALGGSGLLDNLGHGSVGDLGGWAVVDLLLSPFGSVDNSNES